MMKDKWNTWIQVIVTVSKNSEIHVIWPPVLTPLSLVALLYALYFNILISKFVYNVFSQNRSHRRILTGTDLVKGQCC